MFKCPYRRCGQKYATQAEVDAHVVAVPDGDPDHQRDTTPIDPAPRT
jgi:hypothetical protein